jgi:signal transduction histidine kinase
MFTCNAWAADGATPDEIVSKTQEAAAFLAEQGEAGLDVFNQKDSEYVWADTYVFVYDCDKNIMAAHPIKPELAGKNLDEIKDEKGNSFFSDLCTAGKQPGGGWVEYWWTKPDEEGAFRKISYALQAGDGPLQVGAGVYDDSLTVEELNTMAQK